MTPPPPRLPLITSISLATLREDHGASGRYWRSCRDTVAATCPAPSGFGSSPASCKHRAVSHPLFAARRYRGALRALALWAMLPSKQAPLDPTTASGCSTHPPLVGVEKNGVSSLNPVHDPAVLRANGRRPSVLFTGGNASPRGQRTRRRQVSGATTCVDLAPSPANNLTPFLPMMGRRLVCDSKHSPLLSTP